jgi:transcriptional regulator with XRE-family HTH domain
MDNYSYQLKKNKHGGKSQAYSDYLRYYSEYLQIVGKKFCSSRESKNLKISDVADQISFSTRQISEVESGNFSSFIAKVYLYGFLKSYAELLGINIEKTLVKLKEMDNKLSSYEDNLKTNYKKSNGSKSVLGFLTISFVSIISIFYFLDPLDSHMLNSKVKLLQETPESLSASDATVVLASNSLNAQELNDDGVTIQKLDATYVEDLGFTLKAVDDAWFKIKDESNLETDSVFLLRGQEYKVKDVSSFLISTGNLGALEVFLNGESRGVLGYQREIARDYYVNIDDFALN